MRKTKKTLGIRLTLRGWGLLLELHFYSVFNLLNDCHCWTVTIGNQSECEITVFDQLNDLTFRAPRHADTRWHSFFFTFKYHSSESNGSNGSKAGKCVLGLLKAAMPRPSPLPRKLTERMSWTVNRKSQVFEWRGQSTTCLVNVSLTVGDA